MINSRINDLFRKKINRYIIAEVSQNHDGSLGQAHAFIEAAARAGADAIKFQTHIADAESTPSEPFRVQFSYKDKTRYDYWKRMEFSEDEWRGLYNHACEMGIDFLSSPFSVEAFEMLERIGVPAWKFGSGEVFNTPLLTKALQTGKPVLLSTGMSTYDDIDTQIELINRYQCDFALMECTTAYPSAPESIPVNIVRKYLDKYQCIVGISDHSATVFPSLAAATLGASVFEVHVTFSREMFGPDVKASVTMEELAEIVRGVDFIQKMLASNKHKESLDERTQELKNMFSKSIYAKREILPGDTINEGNISLKKPAAAGGLSADDFEEILGKKSNCRIMKDELVERRHLT